MNDLRLSKKKKKRKRNKMSEKLSLNSVTEKKNTFRVCIYSKVVVPFVKKISRTWVQDPFVTLCSRLYMAVVSTLWNFNFFFFLFTGVMNVRLDQLIAYPVNCTTRLYSRRDSGWTISHGEFYTRFYILLIYILNIN